MAFTDQQQRALKAKLRYRHVKMRASKGTSISYVEGWHAIAEANRIFGYDSWDRQTLAPRCLWRDKQRGETTCFYATKVRVTVRAGGATIVREGIGTGIGKSTSEETAHEMGLKAAETDATKRAFATFGNPFGLALYDKDKKGVTKRRLAAEPSTQSHMLHHDGRAEAFASVDAFVTATVKTVGALTTIEAVYAFWEANLDSFANLPRATATSGEDPVHTIGMALRQQVRNLACTGAGQVSARNGASLGEDQEPTQLAIPKDKRIRDKAHLAFVASQPCLVCGRRPAQAHHIRFAQKRALGLKVSDEFTVPLCNGHHDSLHQTGDERAWWARNGFLDPLKIADRLWAASHRPNARNELELLSPNSQSTDSSARPRGP